MTIQFELPAELEQALRDDVKDLDRQAREALLVTLYRFGKISHLALSRALGVDRLEAEEVLHKHQVVEDLGAVEEYLDEIREAAVLRAAGH